MREQYDRLEIEREEQEIKDKKHWISEVERLYREKSEKELVVTSKDFYDNRGMLPEDYVRNLSK